MISKELKALSNPERAKINQRFFKTGKGEYGEGDIFLGIRVPEIREVAKKYSDISLNEVQELLNSKIHEERFAGTVILVMKFKKSEKEIFDFYIKNAKSMNNWDLVDTSAPYIVGRYLLDKDKSILYELAKSDNLWEKRISIISTYSFIKENKFEDTFKISEILLSDTHDLIHKAVGWMIREVGNKDLDTEEKFLKKHYKKMPRTMLRYAIEKFPENKRKAYLKGEI